MERAITIPKNLAGKEDLIIIPRKDYEEYLSLKKLVPMAKPTRAEKKAIQEGKKEIRQGSYITSRKLRRVLEGQNR